MGVTLSYPITSKLCRRAGARGVRVGSAEMQGYRMDMEDAMSIKLSVSEKHPGLSFFGVFDGHGGAKASAYVEQELWRRVGDLDDPNDPAQLEQATRGLDADFRAAEPESSDGHGTTVVWCTVTNPEAGTPPADRRWKICTGNLGDSRAILLRADGTMTELSDDHKPQNEIERNRIVAAGGHCDMNRVDGELALSRAIGDFRYKVNASLPVEEQKVIPIPDVTHHEAGPGDVLLVFCDGIVEQLTNEQVHAWVRDDVKENGLDDPAKLMCRLLHRSLDAGSKDNHSGMCIVLGDEDCKADERFTEDGTTEFVAGPLRPYRNDKGYVEAYLADAERHGYRGAELMRMSEAAEADLPVPVNPNAGRGGAGDLSALFGGRRGGAGGGDGAGGDGDEDGAGDNPLSGMSMQQIMMMAQMAGIQFVSPDGDEDGGDGGGDDDAEAGGGGGGSARVELDEGDNDASGDSPMK